MIKTCIVNATGFDGGGIAKLGIEYSKLGFDVYFKDIVQLSNVRPKKLDNICFYTSVTELISIISKYDRVIFLTFYDKDLDINISDLAKVKIKNPQVEFCYLYCDRNLDRLLILREYLKKYNVEFDYYFSINPNISSIVTNFRCLNVNAFTFDNVIIKPINDRQPIILTAGRLEAFKGVLSYFHSIDVNFLSSEYYYIHEGGRFNFNKTGTVSTPPQLLTLFDTTKSPKQLKSEFTFNHYGEEPVLHKLTIYPAYNPDDINRWSSYYAGICCILGTKHKCRKVKNFLGTSWVVDDLIEQKQIIKKSKLWTDAIEYVNLEMINIGLPVLFSRKYSEIIDFQDESLIYDSFSDIPYKVTKLKDNYEIVTQNQRNLFINRWSAINETIKNVFTEPIR